MVQAQEWLEENYPNKDVSNIYINQQLVGELDCSDYDELWEVYISLQVDSSKFEIKKGSYKEDEETKATEIIHCISAPSYLQQEYPIKEDRVKVIELDINNENLERELDLTDFINLEKLDCSGNYLTSLNLSNCSKLKNINCSGNQLTNLNCSNLKQLEILWCSYNYLTQIPNLPNPKQLTRLGISSNNLSEQDLSVFSQCSNLEKLYIDNDDENKISKNIYNRFVGSLEHLRNSNKLKELRISNTDIDHGLEYLPKSIDGFYCFSTSRPKARVSDIWDELQLFESIEVDPHHNDNGLKKWREVKIDKKLPLLTSPLLPPQLIGKIKHKNQFITKIGEFMKKKSAINYDKVHFNQWGEIKNYKLPLTKKLPTKLYNIQKDKVEETKDNFNIKNYTILSYVWGKPKKVSIVSGDAWTTQYKDKLNFLGFKALYKAVVTCEKLGINHIWVDQLCIDQNDNEEKSKEVPKMGRYYGDASFTLVSINAELGDITHVDMMDTLKKVVNSEWFTRSWTFQEGWLSKQTIFMFNDKLIDGRAMAGTWALNQIAYANEGKYNNRSEFNKGTKKIATPVGWTYYRDGYGESDKVSLTLNQVLKEVKNRGRGVPVDGIYSILGLLPYGEYVKVKYNKDNKYTLEELNQVLYEVMRVAMGYRKKLEPTDYILKSIQWGEEKKEIETIKETLPDGRKVIEYWENGYCEPLAWHGANNKSWMPQIDKYGSTSVEGRMDIKIDKIDSWLFFRFEKESIKLERVATYVIDVVNSNINKLEGGFEIEGGLYQKDVKVIRDNKIIKVSLLGTQKTLSFAEKGKYLVLFDRMVWQSNRFFALLAENTGTKVKTRSNQGEEREANAYNRLGLVELGNREGLQEGNLWDIIIIGSNLQEQSSIQAQIQIPPK